MISDGLYERLLELPKENLLNLMLDAVSEMQASNTRNPTRCIVAAAGGEEKVDPEGKSTYTLPGRSKIIELTANPPL